MKQTITTPAFVPLNQLGSYIRNQSTATVLERARELYEAEPTRAHLENLREAEAEHRLATPGFQEQTKTERMCGRNMVQLYKRLKAATYDAPVANSGLNLYDKRQARELARLGIVAKERIPEVGLAYFAASK